MASAADVLLGDAFARLARFLSGVDLLRLSHANRQLFTELLAPDAREWRRRLAPPNNHDADDDARSAKQRYFQRTSVRFLGREAAEGPPQRDRGGAVEVWRKGLPAHWASESFAVSLTFALLPGEAFGPPRSLVGGVLLGAQSVPWSSKRSPESPQQFVHVDPQGDLYCSVLDQKPVVARALALERWYHVALVFERRGEGLATQRVFLDGKLCHEAVGSLHSEWWNLRFAQLGSGCICGAAPGTPTPRFSGWYGFHGVVDDCRLWRGVLQEDQIKVLTRGREVAESDGCQVTWSLRGSGCDPLGHAAYVRCSGPHERMCTDVRDVRDEFV